MEEAADIAGLTAEGLGAAAEAVSHQFEVIRCPANISAWRTFQHEGADGFRIRRLEVDLRQIHFLLQVIIRDLIF